jgi:hypothetical protein
MFASAIYAKTVKSCGCRSITARSNNHGSP